MITYSSTFVPTLGLYNDVVYNNLDLFSDYNSRFIHSKRNLIYRIHNHKFVGDKLKIVSYKLGMLFFLVQYILPFIWPEEIIIITK